MKRVVCLILGFFFASSLAAANNGVSVEEPTFLGTACAKGHSSVALSEDGSTLSIFFDQYVVTAGGDTGVSTARKYCDVAVHLSIPPSLSVAVRKVDYSGGNDLPDAAYARFSTEYFFAGDRGPHFEETFMGPIAESYALSEPTADSEIAWSQCGKSLVLRSTSNMLVTSPSLQLAHARVDAEGSMPGIVFHLEYKACE